MLWVPGHSSWLMVHDFWNKLVLQNGGLIVAEWWSCCRTAGRQSPLTLPRNSKKIGFFLGGDYGQFFFFDPFFPLKA